MTTMRPFQIIVISIFGVAALGGILAFALFKGFGQAKPIGEVVIWGTLPDSAVQPALDELRRTRQEFNALIYQEHDPVNFDGDLAEAIASGAGPDLIITTQERLVTERSKLSVIPFSTLSERSFRDTYVPLSYLFLTSSGTYGIPIAVDPLVLFYNRSRLASANIPQPPKTWEGVVGMTPSLTEKITFGVVEKSAIALGTYDNIPNARAIVSLLLLQAGNPIVENTPSGSRATLSKGAENASGGTTVDSAIGFYTQFADPAKIVYTWNRSITDARQSFIAGDSALYIGFASERSLIASANPNLDFDMTSVPQPETASERVGYGVVYAFAIPKASDNAEGAYQTAAALAEKNLAGFIVRAIGVAPAARSALASRSDDPYAPIVNSQALIAKGWLSPAPAVTDRIFAGMIHSIIGGRATVHDAITDADGSLSAALP